MSRPETRLVFTSVAALALLSASPAEAQERFYLSTDRIFAPGETPEVKLEAKGLPSLELRVYRIEDPRAYFDAQSDLHRPKEAVAAPRSTTASILGRALRRGMQEELQQLRWKLAPEGRRALKQAFPKLHASALEGPSGHRPEQVVPLLEEHPLVDVWDYGLSGSDSWVYRTVPVPVSEPGAYLVEAIGGGQTAHTVVLVSHVAIVAKQSAKSLLVWAVDPASGAPRPDTEVTVQIRGEVRGTEQTDGAGLARFELGLTSSAVVYAKNGDSFTLLDPRFFPANLPTPRAYVFTERPVYRPGQTVHVKGFARDMADERFVVPEPTEARLEIVDPRGQVYARLTAAVSARGSFDADVELPEAPTHGTWSVFAEIDGERHAGEFKILAFVKPEVKLRVRLDKTAVRSGETLSGDVVGAYYYGAPYPGAEVKITVSRTRFYIPWYVDADYRWYYSEAEYQNTRRETVAEYTCTLDARGECPIEANTKPDSEDFTYVVEAVAQDPKGKTIIGVGRAAVTRGAFRLALDQPSAVTEPGTSQTIGVEAMGYDGAPVSGAKVEVVVSARHVASDGVQETIEALRRTVSTDAQGRAEVEFEPDRSGYYEIVARAKDDLGHEIVQEGFLFVAESGSAVPLAPADVELVPDKKSYFAGDTAIILILTPTPSAPVLFSVEGGDLYRAEVVRTEGHAAVVEVEITDAQTPNFFVTATSVAGGRLYARQRSIIVPPREKLLRVEVAPDATVVEPGDEVGFTVIVTDYAGRPVPNAEIAVGVVDEAIYSVSPEIAVPIESFFYHRKRNDVRSNDSLSFQFFGRSRTSAEAHARRATKNPFSYGSLKPQEDDRQVFEDTAGWFPSLVTDAEGKAKAKVSLPDNLAAWRFTARAVTEGTAVGTGTAEVIAKKPVMVRVAFPPTVFEGDAGQGTLLVQNLSGQAGRFGIALSARAPEGSEAKVEIQTAEPLGEVSIDDGEVRRIPFSYAASGAGPVELVARAEGAGHRDGVTRTVRVVPWARTARIARPGRTAPDAPIARHALRVPDGASPAEADLRVEVYASALGAVRASLPYLVRFPYGCTEQTMSRFVPVLSAQKAMRALSLDLGELEQKLPRAVAAGLQRLGSLQHPDGGWGWWEEDQSDLWMTSWVLEGLAEARSLGIEIGGLRVEEGVTYLERALARAKASPSLRARALLALARHGQAKPAMIEAAIEETAAPEVLAALLLAADAGGEAELVAAAQGKLTNAASFGEAGTSWCDPEASEAMRDATECTALATLALAKTGADAGVLRGAERFLMSEFDGSSFGTTRRTALAVRALCELEATKPSEPATFTLLVNGEPAAEQVVPAGRFAPVELRLPEPPTARDLSIEVRQAGGGGFFHTVTLTSPERRPDFAAQGPLRIERRYFRLEGAAGDYRKGDAATAFTSGEPVLVSVTVQASQAVEHFMLEDLRPAGLDPVAQDSGVQVRGLRLKPKGQHREHRADRTVFFSRQLPRGTSTFHYLARASYPGRFRALPAHAESMYLPARHFGDSGSAGIEVAARR